MQLNLIKTNLVNEQNFISFKKPNRIKLNGKMKIKIIKRSVFDRLFFKFSTILVANLMIGHFGWSHFQSKIRCMLKGLQCNHL